jgi:hypothetical protein
LGHIELVNAPELVLGCPSNGDSPFRFRANAFTKRPSHSSSFNSSRDRDSTVGLSSWLDQLFPGSRSIEWVVFIPNLALFPVGSGGPRENVREPFETTTWGNGDF